MTTRSQAKAHDKPQKTVDPPDASEVIKDPAILTSAWIAGPHPAALAEIEVAEEIEPPTPVPTRIEGDGFEDHVRMYLREIGTVPLLTWDGEKRLARAMEAGNYLQDVIRPPAEAAGAPSVPAMYHELFAHLRVVYRFALADARVDVSAADGWDALRRAARLADRRVDRRPYPA